MAKVVTLTVQVDDAQFQAFTKNFDAFVTKVQNLSTSFQSIQTSITNTTKSAQALNSTLNSIISTSNRAHSSITGITNQFGKWVSLIGATVMMLGGGVGMFGIDRLLNQFIQRQRQALGTGTPFQQNLAGQVAGQQFPGDVTQQLSNIRQAMGDPQHPSRKLFTILGIDTKDKTPEQIRRELLRKGADYLEQHAKEFGPGTELNAARNIGLTDVFGMDKVISMTGAEGKKKAYGEAALSERIEKEVPKVTPEEQAKLDKLYEDWTTFTAVLNANLQRLIAAMQPFLSGITKGMTSLIPNLMPKSWVDWALMAGNAPAYIGTAIIKTLLDVTMPEFKKNLENFSQFLGELISKLTRLQLISPAGAAEAGGGGGGNYGSNPPPPPDGNQPAPALKFKSSSPPLSSLPSGILNPRFGTLPSTTQPGGGPTGGRSVPTIRQGPSTAPSLPSPGFPGGAPSLSPSFTPAPAKSGSIGGSTRFVMQQAPGKGGISSVLAQNNKMLVSSLTASGGPMGRPGPLDMDNYQMGRTASIHVHNEHPSVRMEIAGMG